MILSRLTVVSRVAKKNSLRDVYQESIIPESVIMQVNF